ncbi:zinc finger RNA-binding protein-like [Orbicella faveolata]|uniref:zinc finger RNA-binding protein-like n=1 Tax=Orbicella faveolata TaxID=48498 RepID=UPI0009E519E3|nr:zinc finger RNA-binding protein-like [Orbicella faveolata]
MAASNYYGYSSGGQHSQGFTQAQNPSIQTSYGTPQGTTGYGVQASAPAGGHYVPPQNQAPRQVVQAPYSAGTTAYGQQGSSAQGGAYGYTARQQDAPPPPPPANASYQATHGAYQAHHGSAQYYDREAYETKASYYSQQPSSNVQGGQSAYYAQNTTGATKAAYPTSGTNVYPTSVSATPVIAKTHPTQAYSSQSSTVAYPYSNARTQTTAYQASSYNTSSFGGSSTGNAANYQPQAYEAAVYNAAAAFVQQQHHQQAPQRQGWKNKIGAGQQKQPMMKPKPPPKQPQLHYCDVCKISCAGPQTYREHLEGQKHKKKEQAAKQKEKESLPSNAYRCELCDVTCTGTDAFAAHLKGSKHQKVHVLPCLLYNKETMITLYLQRKEILGLVAEKFDLANYTGVDKSKIVGGEYLEEIKNDDGKVVSFHCKLCECKFNDPNAKEAHLAGRRHRLSYKKKVQPDLVVDVKPGGRGRLSKMQEDKFRRQWEQEQYWQWKKGRHEEEIRRWEEEEYYRRVEEERFWEEERHRRYEAEFFEWGAPGRMGPPRGPPGPMGPRPLMEGVGDMVPPQPMPRPRYDTPDDRLVMAKHSAIYPNEQELQAVQKIVSASEKALKLVSDLIAEQDLAAQPKKEGETAIKKEKEEAKDEVKMEVKESDEGSDEKKEEDDKKDPSKQSSPPRALKGVMRVGVLAKGLLLHERLDVDLVVLCHDKPTKTLMNRVAELLPAHLTKVTEEKYEIKVAYEEAAIKIVTTTDPKVVVTITLTSPVMREGEEAEHAEDDPQVLDRPKCLAALASLRHAKWFQAKANGLQSCVIIIRVMRDLCQRIPAFSPLNNWAMELLVEKALSSSQQPLGPGEAFRRVLECISSGLLLEGGAGLCDPCEKDTVDALGAVSMQEREDLTASAQHALRLQAFRQLHKVLGIDRLPPASKFRRGRGRSFKRRREDSGQGEEGAKKEKKEGEGESGGESMEVSAGSSAETKTETKT